jgi:hypothetical protein
VAGSVGAAVSGLAAVVALAAAAAGSVVSGSEPARDARVARLAVAADRGERAVCVKSADLPVVVMRFDSQNRFGCLSLIHTQVRVLHPTARRPRRCVIWFGAPP